MKRSISQLKEWFRRGKYPTESQFADWMESYFHKDDTVPVAQVENLGWLLNGKFSASRGEILEELIRVLRSEYDAHKADADDEFEKIENNYQALVAEDQRQQAAMDVQQRQITTAAGQLETVRQLLHRGESWATVKVAFDSLGENYSNLWALANTVKTFLEATDTSDATINRWQELEAFLAGVTDSESLVELLDDMERKITMAYNEAIIERIKIHEISWAHLYALRRTRNLLPGHLYRINDYVTWVANDPEARSVGHPFDVVVMALDEATLSERAWAMRSARDTEGYFDNAKLEAWQVWYCLSNDTSRFYWADETNGKGVIYRLIDEWGNDCPYDFKNVQFKRYMTSGDFVENHVDCVDWANLHYILCAGMEGQAEMTANISDYMWFYTFSCVLKPNSLNLKPVIVRDASLINETTVGLAANYNKACNCNEMAPYYIGVTTDSATCVLQALNNIVLTSCDEEYPKAVQIYANRWAGGCYNMTLHEHCFKNTFGADCYNVVGFRLQDCTFGNNCYVNTFGVCCFDNKFGNECSDNTFGDWSCRNTFANYCLNNTFGIAFCDNITGHSCCNNTIRHNCQYNTFGIGCSHNSIGDNCQYNTFGNDCSDIELVTDFCNSTFGNYCHHITFSMKSKNITVGEGVEYLNVAGGSSSDNCVQNAHILNGTGGMADNSLNVTLPAGSKACRYVGLNSAGELKIWVAADLV